MLKTLKIVRLQVGLPRTLGEADALNPMDGEWTTSQYKERVDSELFAGKNGIAGDGQADLIHHGGPDKAINVYPSEHYATFSAELGIALTSGDFGENLSTQGLCESDVCIGDIFRLGALKLQITQARQPCWKVSRRWRIMDLASRMEKTDRTGWYFRVLEEGVIRAGAMLQLVDRLAPEWTVDRANQIIGCGSENAELALDLAACPGLSASWKNHLVRRAEGHFPDPDLRLMGPNRKIL